MDKPTPKALLFNNKKECTGICFTKNRALERIIRKQPGIKWNLNHT